MICSVGECDRPVKARGWCRTHYMFWYKNRSEPAGPIKPWGLSRSLECCVEGCDLPYDSNGYCSAHYKRVAKYGDPGAAEIKPRSVGDDADYALVHARLRKQRGQAGNHACVKCGDPAEQWAYDHEDPDERTDSRGYAFSVAPDHYRPMCTACHKRSDMARRPLATHCAKGHEYTDANTMIDGGSRRCRTCKYAVNEAARRRRAGLGTN